MKTTYKPLFEEEIVVNSGHLYNIYERHLHTGECLRTFGSLEELIEYVRKNLDAGDKRHHGVAYLACIKINGKEKVGNITLIKDGVLNLSPRQENPVSNNGYGSKGFDAYGNCIASGEVE